MDRPLRPSAARLALGAAALALVPLGACGGRIAREESAPIDPAGSASWGSGDWSAVAGWEAQRATPPSPQGDVVDLHHGVEVPDPYRWLEEADAPATKAWIDAQNALTHGLLESIPTRAGLEQRLETLWDYERISPPRVRGDVVFVTRNDGLQDQSVLVVAESPADAAAGSGRVLLDPNTFSEDGTVALAGIAPSPDGSVLAYAISDGGSDWRTWRFVDVATGEHLPDELTQTKFGGLDWTEGGRAVIYPRFERSTAGDELQARNLPAQICLHELGTLEADDLVLRDRPEPGRNVWATATHSRRAMIVSVNDTASNHNELELRSLLPQAPGVGITLIEGFDAEYSYVGNRGGRIWVQTDLDAPNGRVIEIDYENPGREHWVERIPEADVALQGVAAAGGHLIARYLRDASSELHVYDTEGTLVRRVELPGLGSVGRLEGEFDQETLYYTFTGFTTPPEVWSHHVPSGRTELFRRPQVDFDPEAFVTRQVFVTSADGTRVPVFLVHRADLDAAATHPTLLYGYGGFNVSLSPSFSLRNLVWLEEGGIYALANLRGGGEYGEAWHAAGTKLEKQNVFDDFIAAAEWLVAEGLTTPAQLAIEGGSNGGLLVGACMTQRPELFGACLPAVGVHDMLRYHLFTIGWAWAGDYGTVDDADEFQALLAYSPLHNVDDGAHYPATLVTTAARDDRVVPAHSYKFTARLQAAQAGDAPVLIRVETRAGHGAGKPTAMRIEEAADALAFLQYALGHRPTLD